MAASDTSTKTTTQKIADTVAQDAAIAENFISVQFKIIMSYLPKPWQKIAAVVVFILLLWYVFGGIITSIGSFAWGLVPERASVARVMPASQSAVDLSNQVATAAAKRADDLSDKIAALQKTTKNLSDAVANLAQDTLALQQRLDGVETKVNDRRVTRAGRSNRLAN